MVSFWNFAYYVSHVLVAHANIHTTIQACIQFFQRI